jgi:hypothetical protein
MAIRIIHNSKYNAHTESLFKVSAILPLPLLTDFFKLQFMHLYKNDLLPISFRNTWVTNAMRREDMDAPTLRNHDDYYVPPARLSSVDLHPLVYFPKLWNNFINDFNLIGSTANKDVFKKELKTHFLSKLSDNFQCDRLLCPHCHL